MTNDLRISPAGDAALLVQFSSRIDQEINRRAVALRQAVRARCGASVRDVVVGYCSVTVYFDPLHMDASWLQSEIQGLAASVHVGPASDATHPDSSAHAAARSAATLLHPVQTQEAIVDVPVCYGGEYGPDLSDVAAFAGGTTDDVIALHSGTTYRVYVVGFVPGFPYMARLDQRLAIPRRTTPRTRVPAGSVAVAAGQTGIYPSETPGGWHLIGRTHVKPYDASRPRPFLFEPGDIVRFHPIPRDEFERGA